MTCFTLFNSNTKKTINNFMYRKFSSGSKMIKLIEKISNFS